MEKFEEVFKESMKSSTALLDVVMNYILRRKGKQMRPMLVFLSAKALGPVTEVTYVAASLIELLHTATLVHDDVVDDAHERRGFLSLHALWQAKVAVLVGDYLLAQGLLLSVKHEAFELLRIVSTAVREMSEGELLQIEKARRLDITEEVYFDIIRKKTATLIAACTASGAQSVGADAPTIERMRAFGEHLGIAFQIRDDIFDYQKASLIGKPTGNDIKEQKMTLPLIHVLQKAPKSERDHFINTVRRHNQDSRRVAEAIAYVATKGGIDYATLRMNEHRDRALELLGPLPESPAKQSLIELAHFVVEREK